MTPALFFNFQRVVAAGVSRLSQFLCGSVFMLTRARRGSSLLQRTTYDDDEVAGEKDVSSGDAKLCSAGSTADVSRLCGR